MFNKLPYLLTLVALVLAACAPGAATPTEAPDVEPTTASGDSGAPTEAAEPGDSGRCGDRSQLASELQLYTWVEYIDPAIKEQFEAECGVRVVETNFDSNETLLATLQAGSTGYDIIVPSDYMVQILVSENMLQKLDYSNIPNIANMGGFHVNQYFDPNQEYTVPYFWGTSGFAVDTTVLPDAQPSWKTVFEPTDETCGKISLLDDQRETIGAALMYLGYPINDTDPAHLEEAKNTLIEHSECVKAYDSMSHDDLIVQGETVIAHIWTGDAILAGDPAYGGREGIVYMIPEEGCTIWQDNMAIPVGAPNKYTAEVFMNYIADAEIGAQNASYVGYGTPNEAAKAFLDPAMLENKGIYPDEATMGRLQWIEDVGDALELYDRIWTEFKAAAGG
jgi:spermidine/putrescine transport system substrate-binding protein